MTNTSKSRKRCPACGSSNPMDAWECEMCGTSFGDVKPPRSLHQEQAKPPASAPRPAAQPKPAQPKPAPTKTTPAAKPQTQSTDGKSAAKPANASAKTASAKTTTDSFSTPIKNAGSMKKPAPLYASKPRFGLGSLVALVFVAAFGIAAIVFGMNALNSGNNTPAAAPAQPIAVTLDVTTTAMPLLTETSAPTIAPTALPTDAPIEVPAVVPTVAPPAPATATTEPTIAPSPTRAGKPTSTPRPTKTPAATATLAATTAPAGAGETITYTVKGGDTCGAVAKRLGVTVAQIIEQNKLDSRCFLSVGKVLTITK